MVDPVAGTPSKQLRRPTHRVVDGVALELEELVEVEEVDDVDDEVVDGRSDGAAQNKSLLGDVESTPVILLGVDVAKR